MYKTVCMIPWAHPRAQRKQYLDRFSRFYTMTVEYPYTLQCDTPFPQKLPLPIQVSGPHLTLLPGPTGVLNPNGISIGSAVFQGSLV